MKKMMLLALMVAFAALMLAAAPAFATHKCTPSENHQEDCEDADHDNDNNGDDDDGDDNEITSNDRFRFNNVGNFDFSPTLEASQETEQDCDTGEVSQPIDVTGGGENSIQTVGLQPTAVTGCAQNAVGILDADPIFAAQGGDLAFNFDENNVIVDDDCDGEDDGETELEDITSEIDASPSLVVNGGGTIEQAAAAGA